MLHYTVNRGMAREGKEQNTRLSLGINKLPPTNKHFKASPQLTNIDPGRSYITFERREI